MGAGFRTFASGEILTADNVQDYLMDQAVMVFAGTAARGSALPSPETGMTAYSTATGLQVYNGSEWSAVSSVVQVKSVTKTNTFTTTSTSFVDLTDLTLSITPTSATNKILCFYSVIASGLAGTNMGGINLVRGATAISQADAAGVRLVASSIVPEVGAEQSSLVSNSFLDSPATTSATTYKLQIRTGGAGTITVNRTNNAVNSALYFNGTSSLTIMEVTP